MRTDKVELQDGEVRRQHWWSTWLTQVKAAALFEAAYGHEVPRLEAQRAVKAGGWLSAPPVAGQVPASPLCTLPLPFRVQLFYIAPVAPGGALAA